MIHPKLGFKKIWSKKIQRQNLGPKIFGFRNILKFWKLKILGQKFFAPIKFWIQKKMLHLKKIGPKILGPE